MTLDLQSVLVELGERRRQRGEDMDVATMTIVVFFEDDAIGALARDRIHTLAEKHPSRVIVLDGAEREPRHAVEARDWIELGVKEGSADLLRSVVGTLRLPEAPVVLLWIARGIGSDARFAALCENAAMIVYNSSLIDLADNALRELVAYVAEHPALPIADIAYLRLAPWQESVAIFFDGKDAVEELFDLRRVEIGCGSDPEAFYLLGWLASRLGWTPSSPNALCNRFGIEIEFAIVREGEPRRVSRVALRSSRSEFVAQIDTNGETIALRASGAARNSRRYRAINNPGIAALVERAILCGHNDRIFADSLAAAGEILARRQG
jgi:glucose-6-phosphate dehydrogenase assembly protein OpcA